MTGTAEAAIKVLLVDDHAYIRHALGEVFAQTEDIDVVAECADGGEVVGAALRTEPDVVLMDLAMP
jgi:chemotaxis response regulator CheB